MNRLLKYRVWDEIGKKFYYSSDETGRIIVLHVMERMMEGFDDVTSVLQQYTGTNDNKGNEIYEGDIVNVNQKNHKVLWRGNGLYCTGCEYGLDTCWFLGGGSHCYRKYISERKFVKPTHTMNKKEKIKLVNELIHHHKNIEKQFDLLLNITGGDLDSPLGNAAYSMSDSYLDSVAVHLGDCGEDKDQDSWLAWFIHENKCGTKGLTCMVNKKTYQVKNASDLIGVIDAYNKL